MKKITIVLILALDLLFISPILYAEDWKLLAENLIADYKGKIDSIEQLNSTTCWIVLSPDISIFEAKILAEKIGYYIRNITGGISKGKTPIVHVFLKEKHVALARPSGSKYIGKISIEDWNPSSFGGMYRP